MQKRATKVVIGNLLLLEHVHSISLMTSRLETPQVAKCDKPQTQFTWNDTEITSASSSKRTPQL